ncbi:uncharacterized protein LOC144114276 [Amblyomma americanum]
MSRAKTTVFVIIINSSSLCPLQDKGFSHTSPVNPVLFQLWPPYPCKLLYLIRLVMLSVKIHHTKRNFMYSANIDWYSMCSGTSKCQRIDGKQVPHHAGCWAAAAFPGPATESTLSPGQAQNERLGERRCSLLYRAIGYLLPPYGLATLPFTANSGSHFVVRRATWATSSIRLLKKGIIPADTVGHDTAAMHPYSRMLLVQLHFT